jgi:hypothetical protein
MSNARPPPTRMNLQLYKGKLKVRKGTTLVSKVGKTFLI